MDRRKFLGWVGVGALASSLPMVIAACSPPPESETSSETTTPPETSTTENTTNTTVASKPDGEGFVTVGTKKELTDNGIIYSLLSLFKVP